MKITTTFILLFFPLTMGIIQPPEFNSPREPEQQYIRFGRHPDYGIKDSIGNILIPAGKYRSISMVDEKGMIRAENQNRKHGFIDINENILIPFEFDDLASFLYNRAIAKKGSKYGVIDRNGEIVADYSYSRVMPFYHPGIAKIRKNGKFGFIDTLGREFIAPIYDDANHTHSQNEYVLLKKEKKWAIFSTEGIQITAFEYDVVHLSNTAKPKRKNYNHASKVLFNYGVALVEKNGEFALIDDSFNYVVDWKTFNHIQPINYKGFAIVKKDDKYGIVDHKGIIKTPLIYDYISNDPARSYENNYPSYLAKIGNRYRVLNHNGSWINQLEFDSVKKLHDYYYLAFNDNSVYFLDAYGEKISDEYSSILNIKQGFIVKRDGKMGVVDYDNNLLLSLDFDTIISPIGKPYFFVKKGKYFGVIDISDSMILPYEYEYIERTWYNNFSGVDTFIVQKNRKLGTVDYENNIVIPFIYDGISGWVEYGPNAHYVQKDGCWGLIERYGDIVIPLQYESIYYYNSQIIKVQENGKFGVLNRNNKTIVPVEYDYLAFDIDFFGFFFHKDKEEKIVALKDERWSYLNLNGKLIRDDISQKEILEKYPNLFDTKGKLIKQYNEIKDYMIYVQ